MSFLISCPESSKSAHYAQRWHVLFCVVIFRKLNFYSYLIKAKEFTNHGLSILTAPPKLNLLTQKNGLAHHWKTFGASCGTLHASRKVLGHLFLCTEISNCDIYRRYSIWRWTRGVRLQHPDSGLREHMLQWLQSNIAYTTLGSAGWW